MTEDSASNKRNLLFNNFKFLALEPKPIFHGVIPELIMSEIDEMVDACRSIKERPYSFLMHHDNAGQNTFQCSVPQNILSTSTAMAFVLTAAEVMHSRLTGASFDTLHLAKVFRLNRKPGHFSDYDFWVNFSIMGDSAPMHSHYGYFSGVIYVSGLEGSETCFENNINFPGRRGDMLIFPSDLVHWVKERTINLERVTIAFNIITCLED